jgi:hypothetical protein
LQLSIADSSMSPPLAFPERNTLRFHAYPGDIFCRAFLIIKPKNRFTTMQ